MTTLRATPMTTLVTIPVTTLVTPIGTPSASATPFTTAIATAVATPRFGSIDIGYYRTHTVSYSYMINIAKLRGNIYYDRFLNVRVRRAQ